MRTLSLFTSLTICFVFAADGQIGQGGTRMSQSEALRRALRGARPGTGAQGIEPTETGRLCLWGFGMAVRWRADLPWQWVRQSMR